MTSLPIGRLVGTPRRRALLVGALVAVFALAVGYLGGLITSRNAHPGDTSPEAGFARDMSTHHSQAVEMAMVAWQRSADPEIQQLAYDIATVQSNQIGIMQTWLKDWGLSPTSSRPKMAWMPDGARELQPDGLMPGMATNDQIDQLRHLSGSALDVLFCQLMLRHHLGGIHMADTIVKLSHEKQVTGLASTMMNNQQFEVTNLRAKLDKLGAQPLAQ
jgi:uncharacterized protein (DUF305 family)